MYKAGPEVSRGLYRARLLAVLVLPVSGRETGPRHFFFPARSPLLSQRLLLFTVQGPCTRRFCKVSVIALDSLETPDEGSACSF